MSISKDKVKKIGNLAKIKLTNDEIEIYSTQGIGLTILDSFLCALSPNVVAHRKFA